jgi:hypothetical protein
MDGCRQIQGYSCFGGRNAGPDGVASKGRRDAGGIGLGEPLGDASWRRFVDVGWRVEELVPDRDTVLVDVYPYERIDYLDGAGNLSLLKCYVRSSLFRCRT